MPAKGEWHILISHRLGNLINDLKNFFGLEETKPKLEPFMAQTN